MSWFDSKREKPEHMKHGTPSMLVSWKEKTMTLFLKQMSRVSSIKQKKALTENEYKGLLFPGKRTPSSRNLARSSDTHGFALKRQARLNKNESDIRGLENS